MRAISLAKGVTEGPAINAIFDACRANEKRENRGNVVFRPFHEDEYFAVLYDADGKRMASAIIDQFDV
jgi:uncharacterized protein YoaH (UPF0181 family)